MKSNGEVHDHATMKIVGVGLELTLGTNQAKLGDYAYKLFDETLKRKIAEQSSFKREYCLFRNF